MWLFLFITSAAALAPLQYTFQERSDLDQTLYARNPAFIRLLPRGSPKGESRDLPGGGTSKPGPVAGAASSGRRASSPGIGQAQGYTGKTETTLKGALDVAASGKRGRELGSDNSSGSKRQRIPLVDGQQNQAEGQGKHKLAMVTGKIDGPAHVELTRGRRGKEFHFVEASQSMPVRIGSNSQTTMEVETTKDAHGVTGKADLKAEGQKFVKTSIKTFGEARGVIHAPGPIPVTKAIGPNADFAVYSGADRYKIARDREANGKVDGLGILYANAQNFSPGPDSGSESE